MKTFTIEMGQTAYLKRGWGNGYVVIPKGHPAHGLGYDEIHEKWDISVNGGLTFAQGIDNVERYADWSKGAITEEDLGDWVVGFDTAHYRDTLQRWPKEAVIQETEELKNQLEAIR